MCLKLYENCDMLIIYNKHVCGNLLPICGCTSFLSSKCHLVATVTVFKYMSAKKQ